MINFFRKIRQRLLTENKFSKYLLYAIGEIALVVIGILIALNINNKNEAQKTKQFEYEILLDISISMDENFAAINRCLNGNKKAIRSANIILQFLEENLPYHDSLDVHFSTSLEWCSLSLTNAGYESLKTYGRNLITNDTIRENLGIYDAGWIETLAQRQEDYFYNTASPVLVGLFEKVAMRTEMKPFNYEKLKNSNSYFSILKTSKAYREDQLNWYTEWQISLTNTYELINRELKKK
jgi:hypothetical protein